MLIGDFVLNSLSIAIPIFCIATMLAIGLNVTFNEVMASLRNLLAVAIIILVNNIVIPLVGIIVVAIIVSVYSQLNQISESNWILDTLKELMRLDDAGQLGLLLLVFASGSLLGPTLARLSGANIRFAKGIIVILVGASTLLLPIEIVLLNRFTEMIPSESADIPALSFAALFTTLLVYQLLPLVLGMIIKNYYDAIAKLLRPLFIQLTSVSFFVLLALVPFIVIYAQTPETQPETPSETQPETPSDDDGFLKIIAKADNVFEKIIPVETRKIFLSLEPAISFIIKYSLVALIVAVLTMIIGYYGGVAVRNVVGANNEDIPQSMATSTTARNVSFALIILWQVLKDGSGTNIILAISVSAVLTVYIISLIVASHQAVQWSKEVETEEAPNNNNTAAISKVGANASA